MILKVFSDLNDSVSITSRVSLCLVHQYFLSAETAFVNTSLKSQNSHLESPIFGTKFKNDSLGNEVLQVPNNLLRSSIHAFPVAPHGTQITRTVIAGSHYSARCTELVLEAPKHKLLFRSTLAFSPPLDRKFGPKPVTSSRKFFASNARFFPGL